MNLRIPRSGQAAKIAKAYLASEGIGISHTQALELIARLHGYANWQAMQSDKRFENAPALRPVSSDEYDFQYERGESVWVGIENISVYIKREDEGVVVDLFAKGHEDHGSLASTNLFYQEAAEHDEEEETDSNDDLKSNNWFLRYNPQADEWYLTPTDYGPIGAKPPEPIAIFEWGQDALDFVVKQNALAQVQWRGNDDKATRARRFDVLQNGGLYESFEDPDKAHSVARNLALSGAGGHWAVVTDEGTEVGLYLYPTGRGS
jgi:hypothetical protein